MALAGSQWLVGERYSLADGALTPYANRLEMLGMSEMWADKPNFARWFAAVKARPTFEPALFKWLPADLRERMLADGRRAWPEYKRILAKSLR